MRSATLLTECAGVERSAQQAALTPQCSPRPTSPRRERIQSTLRGKVQWVPSAARPKEKTPGPSLEPKWHSSEGPNTCMFQIPRCPFPTNHSPWWIMQEVCSAKVLFAGSQRIFCTPVQNLAKTMDDLSALGRSAPRSHSCSNCHPFTPFILQSEIDHGFWI